MTDMWLPNSYKKSTPEAIAKKTLQEYDERLDLARSKDTGDWVVVYKLDRDVLYPVMRFGQVIPAPGQIRNRLRKADTLENGVGMLEALNQANAKIQEVHRKQAQEADGVAAEAMEYVARKTQGHDLKYGKHFVSRGKNDSTRDAG